MVMSLTAITLVERFGGGEVMVWAWIWWRWFMVSFPAHFRRKVVSLLWLFCETARFFFFRMSNG